MAMVRTQINLPPAMVEKLDKLSEEKGITKSEIIRSAIGNYLKEDIKMKKELEKELEELYDELKELEKELEDFYGNRGADYSLAYDSRSRVIYQVIDKIEEELGITR